MNKKIFSKSLWVGVAIIAASPAQATDSKRYSTFSEYEEAMNAHQMPTALIVGCGHGTGYADGDHAHPDSWCVNVESDPMYRGLPGNKPEEFKKSVQYDEILDITTHQFPLRDAKTKKPLSLRGFKFIKAPIKDNDPIDENACKILNYKNQFDHVLLERPLSESFKNPWTLWNAAHMLKVGGELIIDSTQGYNSSFYTDPKSTLKPKSDYQPTITQDLETLKRFGIAERTMSVNTLDKTKVGYYAVEGESKPLETNSDMAGIGAYLIDWGFTLNINVVDAYQPYTKTGDDLKTARRTRILSAIKTQATEEKMENWAEAIQDALSINPIFSKRRKKNVITETTSSLLSEPEITTTSTPSLAPSIAIEKEQNNSAKTEHSQALSISSKGSETQETNALKLLAVEEKSSPKNASKEKLIIDFSMEEAGEKEQNNSVETEHSQALSISSKGSETQETNALELLAVEEKSSPKNASEEKLIIDFSMEEAGEREIKLPTPEQFKQALLSGKSWVSSDTSDYFQIGTILGGFNGFATPLLPKDIEVEMMFVTFPSVDFKTEKFKIVGLYSLVINNPQFNKFKLLMRLTPHDTYPYFNLRGEITEGYGKGLKRYTRLEKILVPRAAK